MSLKVVIDMNLSPEWVRTFLGDGWQACHWSQIGDPQATDKEIMDWARPNEPVVFTNDLDFGTVLAVTGATGPSVLQVRTRKVLPELIGAMVLAVVRKYENDLLSGALVVVEDVRSRVRVLPLH